MVNYGIGFCKKGIKILENAEDQLFYRTGYGFDRFSREYIKLLNYKEMLKRFQYEKDNGLSPSYNPDIHGTFKS